MWGAGCIMAEMWTRSPIMQGGTEQHQLALITSLCGAINNEVWPGVEQLEFFAKMELKDGKRRVKERLQAYVKDPQALDLIDKLLTLDPSKRYDADTALNHDFFWSDPMPCELTSTLSKLNVSMFELTTPRSNRPGGGNNRPNQPRQQRSQQGGALNGTIYDIVF